METKAKEVAVIVARFVRGPFLAGEVVGAIVELGYSNSTRGLIEDISMLFGEEGMAKVVSLDTGSVSTMSYKLSAMVGVVTRRLESGEVMIDDALI